ncbi:peptidoglycan editing factor PgeF [Neptunomonas japonica]|uniref:peptidoglycan editing factor PgeF n=1 Tax=Neptunomonas japonica TaxID=417574 RepID=UPI000408FBD1|nr:peptidoglycan editing factor PgeF [Neptunomonas japonica]
MQLIRPSWAAPQHIKVASTTRLGGVSSPPYDSLNVGDHVGDQSRAFISNREQLLNKLELPAAQWLTQVHGTVCVEAQNDAVIREADACWTADADLACVIMTADCLPVVFTDGERVAAAHAGWRGLAGGVLETTLEKMSGPDIHVWLGPAIGPAVFEVGDEVRQQFCDQLAQSRDCFVPSLNSGKWLADIYRLAILRLQRVGVSQISGGEYCTYSDAERFFSYRRAPQTGRMATLVWKAAS